MVLEDNRDITDFFNDNIDNDNNRKNGRNCGMSRGDIQHRQQRLPFLLRLSPLSVLSFKIQPSPRLMALEDNRDNNNNRKNGRNIECHEVTYNKDNKDYLFYYGCPPLSVLSLNIP